MPWCVTYCALWSRRCCFVAACSQTGIRKAALTPDTNLPRPSRILIYDFAVSEQEVKEYQGIGATLWAHSRRTPSAVAADSSPGSGSGLILDESIATHYWTKVQ